MQTHDRERRRRNRGLPAFGAILLLGAASTGGDLAWQDELDHAQFADEPRAVAVRGNRAVVVGVVQNDPFFTDGDALIRTYGVDTGDLLWEVRVDDAGRNDAANAVALAPGKVFAAGLSEDETFDTDLSVRAYVLGSGAPVWTYAFDGGPSDIAWAVASRDDSVFAAGQSDAGGPMDFLVVALDAATGEEIWIDRHDFAGADDRAHDVAVGRGGVVFAVGSSEEAPRQSDGLVRAYDGASGQLLWEDRFGGDEYDAARAIAIGRCRSRGAPRRECLFVAASVTNDAGDSDFHVRAYSAASGAVLWTDTYDPTAGFESAGSILFDGGTVFVGGSGTRPRRLDKHILRAYDADSGALIWESRQQSQTEGQGIVGLAAGRGHVCSVGSGIRKRNLDYLVRCHRSRDGDLRWEDRFDLERNSDRALVIARSRGRIVTAGVGTREPPVRNGNLLVRTYEIR